MNYYFDSRQNSVRVNYARNLYSKAKTAYKLPLLLHHSFQICLWTIFTFRLFNTLVVADCSDLDYLLVESVQKIEPDKGKAHIHEINEKKN